MPGIARDLDGRQVLSASAPIAPLGWAVLIEQPLFEAFEPIRASIFRTVGLVLFGVLLSVLVEPRPGAAHGAPDPGADGRSRDGSARATWATASR